MKSTLWLLCLALPFFALSQNASKKILIVGSNVAEYNHQVNGTYLMEIAIPFRLLTQQGFEVDVVTPQGGKTAIYHKGDTVKILKDILADASFVQKTAASLRPDQVVPANYQAIIFPGGYGHFVDIIDNREILAIAARIYESGGVMASLGHGTADLLNIRLSNGEYFVKGKTLTCFPTWAEKEFMKEADYGKLLPVDMQAELTKRGAFVHVCTKENRGGSGDVTVTDKEHRLVTASFADGGEYIAHGILELLKK